MSGPRQTVHVAYLTDAAHCQQNSVRRKCEGADAADGTFALDRVVRVKGRDIKSLCKLPGVDFPNAHGANSVAASGVFAVRIDSNRIKRSHMILRRAFGVPFKAT